MRLALVCNPDSGRGLEPAEVERRLRTHGADIAVTVPYPDRLPGDAEVDRIVLASGDGSVGQAAAVAAERHLPLAVIPGGTANDFARAMGLPSDTGAAARIAATGDRLRGVELGRMDGRPFLNVATIGLAPAAGRRATPLKPALGPLAYSVGAALAGLREKPVRVTARVDGREVFSGHSWQATVACTGAFGGGAGLEEADPHDGRLDLVVVPDGRRAGLLRRAAGMRRGTLASQPGVTHVDGDEIELDLLPGTPVNVDGEIEETRSPTVRFTAEWAAFRLVVG